MSIYPMIDHYIFYTTAHIYNRTKLFFQLLIRMIYFKHTADCCRCLQNISSVCRKNIITCRPDQRNILHDHLTAHIVEGCQLFPRYRCSTLTDFVNDLFSSLCPLQPVPSISFLIPLTHFLTREDFSGKYPELERNASMLHWKYSQFQEKSDDRCFLLSHFRNILSQHVRR